MEGNAGDEGAGEVADDEDESKDDEGMTELLNDDEEDETQELLKVEDEERDEDREVGEGEAASQCVVPVAP